MYPRSVSIRGVGSSLTRCRCGTTSGLASVRLASPHYKHVPYSIQPTISLAITGKKIMKQLRGGRFLSDISMNMVRVVITTLLFCYITLVYAGIVVAERSFVFSGSFIRPPQ